MPDAAIRIRHPATLRTANAVGTLLERCGIVPFTVDAARMLDRSERLSGFALSDPMPRDGLAMLVGSLESEADLSLFGKVAIRSALQRAADARHHVERTFFERPEIADETIRNPVFIVGAPRSGTTILHALLHLDRDHRAPLSWECLLPYPAPRPADHVADKRVDTVRREFDRIFRLVPDFRKKHYMEADSPQECLAITALNFTSFQFLAQAYLPSYHEWFVDADQEQNLRWHRRFLQFLQSGGVRRPRWLLKSPVHLMRLRELFAVYPDAQVIVTHRHPDRTVPSTASIVSSMRSLYSDHEDTSRTGREQLRIWAGYFDRFLRDRPQHDGKAQIVDVLFDDFVRDQMAVVESIYARFGWQLRAEDRARMEGFLLEEPLGKHGVHEWVNEFCPPFEFDAEQGGWGTVDNIYCFCRFRLEPHQYLKITFRSPEACYWGLQTWNYLMQSTNYVDFPVCVNNAQAVAESDGRYEIYLSDRPAPRNWISTAGYREGILFARWLLAEALPETPHVELGSW